MKLNKKSIVAAALGGALLIGGATTMANWTAETTAPGNRIVIDSGNIFELPPGVILPDDVDVNDEGYLVDGGGNLVTTPGGDPIYVGPGAEIGPEGEIIRPVLTIAQGPANWELNRAFGYSIPNFSFINGYGEEPLRPGDTLTGYWEGTIGTTSGIEFVWLSWTNFGVRTAPGITLSAPVLRVNGIVQNTTNRIVVRNNDVVRIGYELIVEDEAEPGYVFDIPSITLGVALPLS